MFTTPCVIKKNTFNLRKKLEELGYKKDINYLEYEHNLYACRGTYTSANFINKYYIDCGTNEELFLALAALGDDSDYMQWFVDDNTGIWERSNDELLSRYMQMEGHKATVEEIIEHFTVEGDVK